MRMIREILLTEYIGAILIGVLIADAFGTFITTIVARVSYYLRSRNDAFIGTHRLSTSYSFLDSFFRIALYLLAAYLIARWLYRPKITPASQDAKSADAV